MTVVEKQNNVVDKNKNWKSELGIVNALDLYFGRVQFDERDMNKIFPTPNESIRLWLAKCILMYQLYRRGNRVVMNPEIAGIEYVHIEIRNWNDDIGWMCEFIKAHIPSE